MIYVSEPKLYEDVKSIVEFYDLKKSMIPLVSVGKGPDQEYEFHPPFALKLWYIKAVENQV